MDYSKIIKETLNGFMCSIKDILIVDKKDFNVKLLKSLVKKEFELLKNSKNYLGTWIDEGKVYIDISSNFSNLDEALKVAGENKQLAIFDLQKMESIYLK